MLLVCTQPAQAAVSPALAAAGVWFWKWGPGSRYNGSWCCARGSRTWGCSESPWSRGRLATHMRSSQCCCYLKVKYRNFTILILFILSMVGTLLNCISINHIDILLIQALLSFSPFKVEIKWVASISADFPVVWRT